MSKKVPKPEGNGEVRKDSINPDRLASLFASTRDLSLLNVKTNQRAQTNKRSYAPNLNVTRNRNVEKSTDGDGSSKRDQRSDRGKSARGRGGKNANANNNNKKGNFIQTVGFLSEGIAAAPINRRGDSHGGSSKDSAAAEVLQKPRIIKRDTKPDKSDLEAEQKKLTDLLGEGGDDELDLDEDSKTSLTDDFLPIKIKDPSKRSMSLNSKKLADIKIKTEPIDNDVVMSSTENSLINETTIKIEPGLDFKSEAFQRMDQLFEATPNEFMLFQLPDALPGRAPDPFDSQGSSSNSPSSKPKIQNLCSLEHLEEGLIGKLVRYKSGKTKLVLGDIQFDVDLGLTSDFQQNAVTINANPTERSANVYSLGPVNGKYNVSPDWIHLFHKMTP